MGITPMWICYGQTYSACVLCSKINQFCITKLRFLSVVVTVFLDNYQQNINQRRENYYKQYCVTAYVISESYEKRKTVQEHLQLKVYTLRTTNRVVP